MANTVKTTTVAVDTGEIIEGVTGELEVNPSIDRALEAWSGGSQTDFYTSITGDDFESKLANYEATQNSIATRENLGKVINLRNVVIQKVEMQNDESGRMQEVPRITLVDEDGTAYHAISGGIFSSLRNLFNFCGTPDTWSAPIPMRVAEKTSNNKRRYYTLEVVRSK